jgi:hypothetical protein
MNVNEKIKVSSIILKKKVRSRTLLFRTQTQQKREKEMFSLFPVCSINEYYLIQKISEEIDC